MTWMSREQKNNPLKSIKRVELEDEDSRRFDPENTYGGKYCNNFKNGIWKLFPFHKVFVCVNDLINHIAQDTENIFVNTTHKEDWVFYHNVLLQLTNTETAE